MKTEGNLFETTCSFRSLLAAYHRARRGKQSREEVARFGWNLEANLFALRDELLGGIYAHGPYRRFVVSDSKRREIKAAPFRDRVVHQAVTAALEPVCERGFIFDSYACRKRKGTHAALRRFESFIRPSSYVLLCDISKYFATIRHETLLVLIERRIRDRQMIALCRTIIDSCEEEHGRGIPIGNLTSQLFANLYLNELDQFVKHVLRARRYVRYMDDFLIVSENKRFLNEARALIAEALVARLGLALHPKKAQIAPVSAGVDFLGYRVFPHHRLLRKSTVKRFVKRTRRAQNMQGGVLEEAPIRSWLVYAREASSYGLRRSLSARLGISLIP